MFSDILDHLTAEQCDHLNRLFITYKAMAYKNEALVRKAVAKMNITTDELAALEREYFCEKNKIWGELTGGLSMLAAAGYGFKLARDRDLAAKRANQRLPFEIALLSQLTGQYEHAIEGAETRFIPPPSSTAPPRRLLYEKPFARTQFREQELAYGMGILAHLPYHLQQEIVSFLPGMQTYLQADGTTKGKTRGHYYLDKAKELVSDQDKQNTSKCTIL